MPTYADIIYSLYRRLNSPRKVGKEEGNGAKDSPLRYSVGSRDEAKVQWVRRPYIEI